MLLLYLCSIILISTIQFCVSDNVLDVITTTGPVRGIRVETNCAPVKAWYGIPYARPPVKELRYKPPVRIPRWNKIFLATKQPKACMQSFVKTEPIFLTSPDIVSEDCLYLNIVKPANVKSNATLPVMVWIHGGGLVFGAISNEIYDTQCLASTGNVIVVSIQYRLGNFGFLYISNDTVAGNMGLLDQQLALNWIKENIRHFGGDSTKITVFGQSAGAASVLYQMAAPSNYGLFNRAIIQSGSVDSSWNTGDKQKLIAAARKLAKDSGCTENVNDNFQLFRCLQTIEPQILIKFDSKDDIPEFAPITDGVFLNDSATNLLQKRSFEGFDLLIGTTHDEMVGPFFSIIQGLIQNGIFPNTNVNLLNKQQTVNLFNLINPQLPSPIKITPNNTDILIDYYAVETNQNYFYAISRLSSDLLVDCPVNRATNIVTKRGGSVYKYLFSHSSTDNYLRQFNITVSPHSEELSYIFGEPLKKKPGMRFTSDEKKLSLSMIMLWTYFAKEGVPGQFSNQNFPLYDDNDQQYLNIDINTNLRVNGMQWRKLACDYLESMGLLI